MAALSHVADFLLLASLAQHFSVPPLCCCAAPGIPVANKRPQQAPFSRITGPSLGPRRFDYLPPLPRCAVNSHGYSDGIQTFVPSATSALLLHSSVSAKRGVESYSPQPALPSIATEKSSAPHVCRARKRKSAPCPSFPPELWRAFTDAPAQASCCASSLLILGQIPTVPMKNKHLSAIFPITLEPSSEARQTHSPLFSLSLHHSTLLESLKDETLIWLPAQICAMNFLTSTCGSWRILNWESGRVGYSAGKAPSIRLNDFFALGPYNEGRTPTTLLTVFHPALSPPQTLAFSSLDRYSGGHGSTPCIMC
ncbi:unnamed protein product [Blumeria hordei]|uniref:Uncharacterized protein n=1 Tax=Blumeria hordei TaxID=2867405 RepID=A0A383UZ16_BLUHO|nr:unnamed protein product [Blumeria hordei]